VKSREKKRGKKGELTFNLLGHFQRKGGGERTGETRKKLLKRKKVNERISWIGKSLN